ncbi:uncharacterized protein SRS1_14552 [Sporisorium reilianum f. sp. reilianum]|uniref:Uncharacterized protein n=1 Tax=Sporisorium reilianum f. sp. reilianum TaxID=72559 RepID=A0A2N8UFS6_9BASI|nr:uncharacterized protein SRS1_14552 [Sporisorium reilianum f. sp. reilianum]
MADYDGDLTLDVEQASIPSNIFDVGVEKVDRESSSGSGSLTQRAAMIRDELLGNDSLEPGSAPESLSSSGTSAEELDSSSQKSNSKDEEAELEERLNNSAISHSLRHIAMAFDEKSRELESLRKIQQTHEEEMALLRAQFQNEKEETQALTKELDELKSSHAALSCELEALKSDVESKDELLCLSDRISSRLFDMIHAIKAQIEAAETLSPAIRSISSSSSAASFDSDSASVASSQAGSTPAIVPLPTPIEALTKQSEAKYSGVE